MGFSVCLMMTGTDLDVVPHSSLAFQRRVGAERAQPRLDLESRKPGGERGVGRPARGGGEKAEAVPGVLGRPANGHGGKASCHLGGWSMGDLEGWVRAGGAHCPCTEDRQAGRVIICSHTMDSK